ncbi:MAG TPA: Pvc16 family protein [Candidatus Dormibacteraeota bacterium]|jgi:hypothetical protein|nr:Pvc16 family protein [Candidatus Dormibacteraeota bacterium]
MIGEVDEALRRLVEGAELGDARVVLDRPHPASPPESPGRVALHLCAVSEDIALRTDGWEDIEEDGRIAFRRPVPRWYELAYEVTAVAGDATEEHRLLDAVLRRLVLQEILPPEHITGSLLELGLGVPLKVALPRPRDGHPGQAPRRPVIEVLVTAPLRPDLLVPTAPPARTAELAIGRSGGAGERISATPGDPAMRRAVPGRPPPA